MAEQITYYAITDELSGPSNPGVLRRVRDDDGPVDEIFTQDHGWEFSPILYAAERGDTMFDFTEISQAEAERIVALIRAAVADDS